MQTYKAKGTITTEIGGEGTNVCGLTEFSILLKKPNHYCISWTQKDIPMSGIALSGAVWNDGTLPYLYLGGLEYFKMDSDEDALVAAAGISSGSAITMPSFFLSIFKEQSAPFSMLKEPKLEKIEKVGDEDCYVITECDATLNKETFWISKHRYLLIKYFRSLEMSDEEIKEAIRKMAQDSDEETKQEIEDMLKSPEEILAAAKVKASFTELYVQISSPELGEADFQFKLPKGAVLK